MTLKRLVLYRAAPSTFLIPLPLVLRVAHLDHCAVPPQGTYRKHTITFLLYPRPRLPLPAVLPPPIHMPAVDVFVIAARTRTPLLPATLPFLLRF